jgi:hypothetical protein
MTKFLSRTFVDRTGWPHGKWDEEPDEVTWIHPETGYPCLMRRHPWDGIWCGYVGVDRKHPLNGISCFDLNKTKDIRLPCHWEFTYTGPLPDEWEGCLLKNPDVWLIGFDCGRGTDLYPNPEMMPHLKGLVYRDLSYVSNLLSELSISLQKISHLW